MPLPYFFLFSTLHGKPAIEKSWQSESIKEKIPLAGMWDFHRDGTLTIFMNQCYMDDCLACLTALLYAGLMLPYDGA